MIMMMTMLLLHQPLDKRTSTAQEVRTTIQISRVQRQNRMETMTLRVTFPPNLKSESYNHRKTQMIVLEAYWAALEKVR